jgi:hypothetical protein
MVATLKNGGEITERCVEMMSTKKNKKRVSYILKKS